MVKVGSVEILHEVNHQKYSGDEEHIHTWIKIPSMSELGNWLLSCKPLLERGDFFLYS